MALMKVPETWSSQRDPLTSHKNLNIAVSKKQFISNTDRNNAMLRQPGSKSNSLL